MLSVDCLRCLGAASQAAISCPKQASPFTVKQLEIFHSTLCGSDELWDRAMAGMVLFCVYGRARWSDAQHAEGILVDRDTDGNAVGLEVKTSIHKTARALQFRHMFLPMTAPAIGVTQDRWADQWMDVRKRLQIEDMKVFPLLPAPDSQLQPTKRPVTTTECKKWMHHLLGFKTSEDGIKISSHSCKATMLSFLAKRGAPIEDRLVLGYHSNKLRVAMTYSRDSSARPLALLSHMLKEIREPIFEAAGSKLALLALMSSVVWGCLCLRRMTFLIGRTLHHKLNKRFLRAESAARASS